MKFFESDSYKSFLINDISTFCAVAMPFISPLEAGKRATNHAD